MFFQGTVPAGASITNMFNDIVGLLTGSITVPGSLNVAWTGVTLINTVAAGWTLHDNAAGSAANGITPVAIRAAYVDDAAKYKNIYINSVSATVLGFRGYETWDSGAHTGTNPAQSSAVTSTMGGALAPLTAGNCITISASAQHIFIEVSSSAIGNCTQHVFVSEFSRDDPWNTVGNGYPPWVLYGWAAGQAYTGNYICRVFNTTSLADVASCNLSTGGQNQFPGVVFGPTIGAMVGNAALQNGSSQMAYQIGQFGTCNPASPSSGADSNKLAAKYLYELRLHNCYGAFCQAGSQMLFGNLSSINGATYCCAHTVGAVNDDVVIGGNTYNLRGYTGSTYGRIAIKKV